MNRIGMRLGPGWRGAIAAAVLALLSACQTTPPPAPAAARADVLQRLGFVRGDSAWELSLGVKLLFEIDSDAVSDAGRSALGEVAQTLAEVGVDRVRVEGHTDSLGSPAYNRSLSLRRAESVAQQLIRVGWRNDAIERRGHGADKPVADNAGAEGRAQNRRVVVTVEVD